LLDTFHGLFDVVLEAVSSVDGADVIKVLLEFFSAVLADNVIILAKNFGEIIGIHERERLVVVDERILWLHTLMLILQSEVVQIVGKRCHVTQSVILPCFVGHVDYFTILFAMRFVFGYSKLMDCFLCALLKDRWKTILNLLAEDFV
jgi:hypothetical protein